VNVTRGTTHDALLAASSAGWPTTLRYALLLLVTRGTIGAAVLLLLR
jgi:hypothetical protein